MSTEVPWWPNSECRGCGPNIWFSFTEMGKAYDRRRKRPTVFIAHRSSSIPLYKTKWLCYSNKKPLLEIDDLCKLRWLNADPSKVALSIVIQLVSALRWSRSCPSWLCGCYPRALDQGSYFRISWGLTHAIHGWETSFDLNEWTCHLVHCFQIWFKEIPGLEQSTTDFSE